MKLAIIIPYYKIDFFRDTLTSIENQTDKRFNLYIGNDASPQDPIETIKSTLKTTPYRYFDYKENVGGKNLAAQWKRVIAESSDEEWILILGDDDQIEANFVEEFYKNVGEAEKAGINLIKFSNEVFNEKDEKLTAKTKLSHIFSSIKFLERRLTGTFPTSLSENVFTRKAYEKHSFKEFPLAWHSDDLAVLEFSDAGNFLFVDGSQVKIKLCEQTISGQDNSDPRKHLGGFKLIETLLSKYSKHFSPEFSSLLLKRYRESIWRHGFPMNIDITKKYLEKGQYLQAMYSFKIKHDLRKRIKILQNHELK